MEGLGITMYLDSLRHMEMDEISLCGFLVVKRQLPVARDDDDATLTVP